MQYSLGTVAVTNGSPTVVGTGTLWSTGPQGPLPAGSLFTISASGVPYFTAAVPSDDTHVALTANYAGSTLSGLAYNITTSFTTNYNLPYMNAGDVDTATIFKAALSKLDQLIGGTLNLLKLALTGPIFIGTGGSGRFSKNTTATNVLSIAITFRTTSSWMANMIRIDVSTIKNNTAGAATAWYLYHLSTLDGSAGAVSVQDSGGGTGSFAISITGDSGTGSQVWTVQATGPAGNDRVVMTVDAGSSYAVTAMS